mgnify:CR=1
MLFYEKVVRSFLYLSPARLTKDLWIKFRRYFIMYQIKELSKLVKQPFPNFKFK